jgi:hypothetical protein
MAICAAGGGVGAAGGGAAEAGAAARDEDRAAGEEPVREDRRSVHAWSSLWPNAPAFV